VDFDIFFSISRTPVDGFLPTEARMFRAFFEQVEAADALGFGTAWIAESHLSSEVQKRHPHPVIPFWQGEVGLNADIVQMAHAVFRRTQRIEVGSAVMGLFVNGGPIAHAERIAQFLAIHGLDPGERRKLNIGFAAGRFDFQSRAHGMKPRNAMEEAAWPVLKGKAFAEAAEIFCRLVRGDELSSGDVRATELSRPDFRSDADWRKVLDAHGADVSSIPIPRRYEFDVLKIVPEDVRKELLELYVGSHDARLQEELNAILPVRVFNLSITKPEVIEDTHRRMAAKFHAAGGGPARHAAHGVRLPECRGGSLEGAAARAAGEGPCGALGLLDGARGHARPEEGRGCLGERAGNAEDVAADPRALPSRRPAHAVVRLLQPRFRARRATWRPS
jgi:hypothetical protein